MNLDDIRLLIMIKQNYDTVKYLKEGSPLSEGGICAKA